VGFVWMAAGIMFGLCTTRGLRALPGIELSED